MTDGPESSSELTPAERNLLTRLSIERPVPAAGFRGTLGRHLAARDPGYGPRPERLHLLVGAFVLAGLLLIATGALIATGVL